MEFRENLGEFSVGLTTPAFARKASEHSEPLKVPRPTACELHGAQCRLERPRCSVVERRRLHSVYTLRIPLRYHVRVSHIIQYQYQYRHFYIFGHWGRCLVCVMPEKWKSPMRSLSGHTSWSVCPIRSTLSLMSCNLSIGA